VAASADRQSRSHSTTPSGPQQEREVSSQPGELGARRPLGLNHPQERAASYRVHTFRGDSGDVRVRVNEEVPMASYSGPATIVPRRGGEIEVTVTCDHEPILTVA